MSNFLVANAQNLQQYLKATGTGTDADPFVVSHAIDIEDQVRNAVENLSTLTEEQVQSAFQAALSISPAGGANQEQVQEAVIAAITNTLIQAVDFNIKTAINNINTIVTEGSFGGDSLFDTISSAIASKLNVQFQEWLSTNYQTVLATTISASIVDALYQRLNVEFQQWLTTPEDTPGSFGEMMKNAATKAVEFGFENWLAQDFKPWLGDILNTGIIDRETIGRIIISSVSATDRVVSIPTTHPWYGKFLRPLSWYHNSTQTTDTIITFGNYQIQLNDQLGAFPDSMFFNTLDTFSIRRLTAGSSYSIVIHFKPIETIADLII